MAVSKFVFITLAIQYNIQNMIDCLWSINLNLIFVLKQTAQEAMTPIESTFSLDVETKLDW